jgi:hypothetical protein
VHTLLLFLIFAIPFFQCLAPTSSLLCLCRFGFSRLQSVRWNCKKADGWFFGNRCNPYYTEQDWIWYIQAKYVIVSCSWPLIYNLLFRCLPGSDGSNKVRYNPLISTNINYQEPLVIKAKMGQTIIATVVDHPCVMWWNLNRSSQCYCCLHSYWNENIIAWMILKSGVLFSSWWMLQFPYVFRWGCW